MSDTRPINDPPPGGPGRMSDRALLRIMRAVPIILAVVLAVVVLAGGAS